MPGVPANMSLRYRRCIQMALNEKTKSHLVIDGDFGAKSVEALKQYQTLNKLPVTGVYDLSTRAVMDPFIKGKYLKDEDFATAGQALSVSPECVMTVVEVEAGGDGFLDSGDCDILFERHIFFRRLSKKKSAAEMQQLVAKYPNLVNPNTGGYSGGQKEWDRLNAAIAIDRTEALNSASWGMFQVMGFNCAAAGWSDIEQFVTDMKTSESKHLTAFVGFVKANPNLHKALKAQDWASFARGYNGAAYAKNNYDKKLAAAYAKFTTK